MLCTRHTSPRCNAKLPLRSSNPATPTDQIFIRRFEVEAPLVAQLEHLHIVPLYDYWRDPEGAYLVMRLMKGGSLAEALAEGEPLEASACHPAGGSNCAPLGAAHQQGVVHHDIKTHQYPAG